MTHKLLVFRNLPKTPSKDFLHSKGTWMCLLIFSSPMRLTANCVDKALHNVFYKLALAVDRKITSTC